MTEDATRDRVAENWRQVCKEVAEAAIAVGRKPESVRVIGVSKYVDAQTTLALAEAGCHDLGESRPQALWQKAETLANHSDLRWHLIGHLQRNKVRRVVRQRPVIHSIDSDRLLRSVADESADQGLVTSVLLEVNISGDQAKTGLRPDQIADLIEHRPTTGVRIIGLMAMAGWGTDSDSARRQFEQTRCLRDQLQQRTGLSIPELSMGMSGDFRAAIAAGATMVRIGSRLFDGIED